MHNKCMGLYGNLAKRPEGTTYLKTFVPIISQRRLQCNVLAGVQIYGLRTRREEI